MSSVNSNSFIDNLNIVNNSLIRATAKIIDLLNALKVENNQNDLKENSKRSDKNLNRLADSFGNKEKQIIKDLNTANNHLILINNDLLNKNPIITQGDFNEKQRLINSINTSTNNAVSNAEKIKQQSSTMSASNKTHKLKQVGAETQNKINTFQNDFATTKNAFNSFVKSAQNGDLPKRILSSFNISGADLSVFGFDSNITKGSNANAHLLIITTLNSSKTFYFNLNTASFDKLKRETRYNIAPQTRLTKQDSLQAISKGNERITLSGLIFTKRNGANNLKDLRTLAEQLEPMTLTTGYGEVIGDYYLTSIEEEQSDYFADGIAKKQMFNLEFTRYGKDEDNDSNNR